MKQYIEIIKDPYIRKEHYFVITNEFLNVPIIINTLFEEVPEDKINEKVLKNAQTDLTLLKQQASCLKNNPKRHLKEPKQTVSEEQEMLTLKKNFSDIEKAIIAGIEDNPKFLENVQKYITWANKQKKCKKYGK